jgi:hypothetical protein
VAHNSATTGYSNTHLTQNTLLHIMNSINRD